MSSTILNFASLEAEQLKRQPYDYMVVNSTIHEGYHSVLQLDFPDIRQPGSFPLKMLNSGPSFQGLIQELLSPEFERLISQKFELDLSPYQRMVTCRGYCSRKSDGKIHTDSKNKVISVLLYLNDNWQHAGGRLRLLHRPALEDYAEEIAPEFGTMLLFRRCDHSFHGHLPYEGRRLSIQLNWVRSEQYKNMEALRHYASAFIKAVQSTVQSKLRLPVPTFR
jgi:hypothetical protein